MQGWRLSKWFSLCHFHCRWGIFHYFDSFFVQQPLIWWLLIRYGGFTCSRFIFGWRREFKRVLCGLRRARWYVLNVSQPPRFISSSCLVGDTVAKFSGINVHKRLVAEAAYREKRYEEALKRAFLGTDEDFLAGYFLRSYQLDFLHLNPKNCL